MTIRLTLCLCVVAAFPPFTALAQEHGRETSTSALLEWIPCTFDERDLTFGPSRLDPERLRCGRLAVLEDRRDRRAGARRIDLAFAVIAAERSIAGAVPVVYLHGGPGAGALDSYFLGLEGPALAVERDVIAFDQRGAGRSEPKLCRFLATADVEIAARDLTPAGEAAARRQFRRECLEDLQRRQIEPGAYDMKATIADLEDLRLALGYERWSLFGRSYGGVLAQRILGRHPETLHAVVLLNPIPLDWSNFDQEVPALATTLERVFRDCEAQAPCRGAYPDPAADLYRAYEALREDPWTIEVDGTRLGSPTFVVNATDLMWIVNDLLYADFDIRQLPAILHALAERLPSVARAVVEDVFEGWLDGAPVTAYSVWCRDAVDVGSRLRASRAAAPYPEALRAAAFLHLEVCEDWPVEPGPTESRRPVETDIPVLLLSGGYDHIAPAEQGSEILQDLVNGRQVVFESSSHILPGNEETAACAFRIVRDFLAAPHDSLEVGCVAGLPLIEYVTEPPGWIEDRPDD